MARVRQAPLLDMKDNIPHLFLIVLSNLAVLLQSETLVDENEHYDDCRHRYVTNVRIQGRWY